MKEKRVLLDVNDQMLNAVEVKDLLNNQDKKIKELEDLVIKDNGKIYRKNNKIKKLQEENERLYNRIYELKKNQNSKAIEVLEKAKIEFETYYADNIWNYPEWIDNQITELRGGENE